MEIILHLHFSGNIYQLNLPPSKTQDIMSRFRSGVLHGDEVTELLRHANENNYALPAVNVIGTNSANAVLETARDLNSPVIIQFSNGGGVFFGGKGLSNDNQAAAIAGSVSGAMHIHNMAKAYGVPVILHTDHCAKKLLPWVDGMLDHGEKFFENNAFWCYVCSLHFSSKLFMLLSNWFHVSDWQHKYIRKTQIRYIVFHTSR